MIAILSCVAGVLGMLALWIWAWRLWKQSAVPAQEQRSVWLDESKPRRRVPSLPPSWLFEDVRGDVELDAPRAREQPSSNAITDLFAREERTELLGGDGQIIDPAETQAAIGGRTCKLGLFRRP